MKLIDILVDAGDETPLFGVHTKYLAMDPDGRVHGYCEMPSPTALGWGIPDALYSTDGRGCLIQLDRDDVDGQWQSAIITLEQYEAALAAKNDGWIEWGGGEYPPISTNTVVDVKLRCGSVTVRQPAGIMNWRSNAPDEPGDIIAYRLHQMQEADLNECIGQDAVPVWNGEGLPPVGCDVEYHCYPDGWVIINIVARIKGATFIEWKSGTHKGGDIIRGDFPLERVRPLRTEAERAIDEMVRLSGVSIGAAKILYDAGYRK